jgi:predicted PolB exonuclease-like 3'-5' exonuclease
MSAPHKKTPQLSLISADLARQFGLVVSRRSQFPALHKYPLADRLMQIESTVFKRDKISALNPTIVFDIETVPDATHKTGDGFPKPAFHNIVAISMLEVQLVPGEHGLSYAINALHTGGTPSSSEEQLVVGFFNYIERKKPRLVTFNGRAFDLPVLKYRALKYGVSAPWFANGHGRWENYGQRYSVDWHVDLMDALAEFGATKFCSLDEVCSLIGVPGKLGITGSQIGRLVEEGRITDVLNYCETDVLSTYLIFLRYALFRGEISNAGFELSVDALLIYLAAKQGERPHLGTYLEAWTNAIHT